MFSKILLSLSVCLYFYQFPPKISRSTKAWITGAFFFCVIGDAVLLLTGSLWFLLGMVAFALFHLIMIVLHLRWYRPQFHWSILAVILLGTGSFFGLILYMDIPSSLIAPVYIYSLLMLLHLTLAQASTLSTGLSRHLPWGVLLFLLSDMILAFQKFGPLESLYLDMAVMALYAAALYFILAGFKLATDKVRSVDQ